MANTQTTTPLSVPHNLSLITKPFTQTLLTTLDGTHDIKIALLSGSVPFHSHPDNDEAFYVVSGSLIIELKPGGEIGGGEEKVEQVHMKEGDLFVVKKGVVHRPVGKEARVMVIEKVGVVDGSGGIAKPIKV